LLWATVSPAALGPRYGGELRVGVAELPSSLAPKALAGTGNRLAQGLVHQTLLGVGTDGQPTPGLAVGWTSAAEGREWTVMIADAALFHDDRVVAAEDAVRSLKAFLRGPSVAAARLARSLEGGAAFRARTSEEIAGIAAPGPRRLVLRFVAPGLRPLAPLASPAAAVTSSGGAGAGPFAPTVVVPGQRLGLTAFAAHTRGRPYLDRLLVAALPEPAALANEAREGRLDLAAGEAGLDALAATLLLVLDPRRSPFDRAEVRAAVATAIDRVTLVNRLVPGGRPTEDLWPASSEVPDRAPPDATPPGPAAPPARPALVEGEVALVVSRDVPPLVSQRVVAHLVALGLHVRVVPAAPTDAAAAADVRLLAWSPEVPEVSLALEELAALCPPSPAVRDLLEAAAATTDPDRRQEGLRRAAGALRDLGTLVPLALLPVRFGGSRRVHGARIDGAARLVLEDAWVEP
jgi:ABC-type transport system substrate-binding protein